MRIKVKVKNIEIEIDDSDNNAAIMYSQHNAQVQATIKVMCQEAIKILEKSINQKQNNYESH